MQAQRRRSTGPGPRGGGRGGATTPNGAEALVGAVIGDDFQLRRVLSRGSESIAYIAEQKSMGGREVVVKVLDELFWRLVSREKHREANPYLKEIRVATMLSHPAFPHLYRAGALDDGRPWMAMEYLQGKTLDAHLKDGPLAVAVAARLADELLGALRALHAGNVIHRDLKPDHLILQPTAGDEYRLRILDLGHAQSTYQSDLPKRLGGGPIGSPGYLSPELAEGRPADERSDVFSAGLLVYEMLAGVPAIHIEDGRAEVLVAYVRSDAPLPTHPLGAVREELPEALEAVVARALDRNPRRRYATAAAFRDALRAALGAHVSGDDTNGDGGVFGRIRRAFKR